MRTIRSAQSAAKIENTSKINEIKFFEAQKSDCLLQLGFYRKCKQSSNCLLISSALQTKSAKQSFVVAQTLSKL